MFTSLKAGLAFLLVFATAPTFLVAAQTTAPTRCFSDWSTAASIVTEEKLVTVEALSNQFKRQNLGEIVKTDLCREPTGYVYRIVIRSPNGRFRSTLYDARRGIEIGVAKTGR